MPFAAINGQNIFFEDSSEGMGQQLGSPVVIFMHGFLFDQSMFGPQVKALAADYRCVRFDARAHGLTHWDGKPFTLYDTVADAIGLMDYLGIDQAAFVGMLQGGYALIRLALQYPERVKAAVFAGTYNGVDTEDVKAIYRVMRDEVATPQGKKNLFDIVSSLSFGGDPVLRVNWEMQWNTMSVNSIIHGMNPLIDRDVISDERMMMITQPSLIIHGEADPGIPIALPEMTLFRVLPNVKDFVRVANASQAVNLVNPEAFNTALKTFLDEYGR